jgi:hypothetical protein
MWVVGLLITLLQNCVMDNLGWCMHNIYIMMGKKISTKHLDMIQPIFCHPKKLGNNDKWVLEVLSRASLDI